MYYVYILRSQKNGTKYVGFTGKLPEERLKDHNDGSNKFTRLNKPFELIYFEEYKDRNFAIKRERFLKSGIGRKLINKKLRDV
ncbi:MAG: GIY-YIG nuclease family protein [Candidatus Omnitrophica bacterium]|nr:GIY-YIG nuclease family protein [Candidatus Omnitrophota bacterium]